MIKDLADTIIWTAEERVKEQGVHVNSAIHAITLEVDQFLMEYMKDHNPRKAK